MRLVNVHRRDGPWISPTSQKPFRGKTIWLKWNLFKRKIFCKLSKKKIFIFQWKICEWGLSRTRMCPIELEAIIFPKYKKNSLTVSKRQWWFACRHLVGVTIFGALPSFSSSLDSFFFRIVSSTLAIRFTSLCWLVSCFFFILANFAT